MEILLEPHYEATRQRLAGEKLVLAVQDTTSLNYTTHRATDDLGPIGTQAAGAVGLWLHSTLAFNAEGTPLGLLDVQCWARDGRQFGKHHERKKRSIEEKESAKWLKSFRALAEVQRRTPGTRLVSVGDREADIYELFQEALADPQGPGLLVRAEQDRLAGRGAGTRVALAGAASGGGGAGNRRAPTGRATGARGASGSALCPSHFAAPAQQAEAAGADAVGSVGAGGRGPRGHQALALDAAHHLRGRRVLKEPAKSCVGTPCGGASKFIIAP